MSFQTELNLELEKLRAIGRFRSLRTIVTLAESRAAMDGRIYCNCSGNDYLGIAGDPELRRTYYQAFPDTETPELALSSASSRLLTGSTPAAEKLESKLASLYGRAALVFNSGYHANVGILPALSQSGDLILADKLDHASIIDGLKLSDAEFKRYRHQDLEQLEKILAEKRASYKRVFVVTESVFSMDGDCTDLKKLVELKEKYDAVLVVDEAHAVGVRGPAGRGLAAEFGVADRIDVLIGTFGKALGSTGAFAIVGSELRDYLINRMRPFIFSTALPPVIYNWSCFTLERAAEMDAERAKLQRMGRRLRELFAAGHAETCGDTQIVPYLVGADADAVALAGKFQKNGFLVFPIRPPTVPPGTSRLRFSLSAAMREEDIEEIGKLL